MLTGDVSLILLVTHFFKWSDLMIVKNRDSHRISCVYLSIGQISGRLV